MLWCPGRSGLASDQLLPSPTHEACRRVSMDSPLAGAGLRILIVEDQPDTAEFLRLYLALQGCEVRVAHTGLAGLDLAREWLPDGVFCDIGLPDLNGYGVAEELRRNRATAATCLVAVTAYGSDRDRERAKSAGFDYHFVK